MSVQKVDKTTGNTTLIAGATLYADSPIGTILAYGGATAPSGWMLCQGQELTKTDYAELYAVIGDSFGTASVNTKFVLPDLREATTKGVGLTGKSNNHYDSDGVALGEFVEDRIQDHGHSNGGATAGSGGSYICSAGSSAGNVMSYSTVGTTARNGATTEVKAVGVNYIIKAKQVALPADLESAVEDAVEDVYGDIIPSSASSSNKVLVNSDKTSAVTSGSDAPITSGGVFTAMRGGQIHLDSSMDVGTTITRTFTRVAEDYLVTIGGWHTSGSSYRCLYYLSFNPRDNNPVIKEINTALGETMSGITSFTGTISNDVVTLTITSSSSANIGSGITLTPI